MVLQLLMWERGTQAAKARGGSQMRRPLRKRPASAWKVMRKVREEMSEGALSEVVRAMSFQKRDLPEATATVRS